MRALAAAVGTAGGLLAGCTVGPAYHGPPADAVPGHFKNGGNWKIGEPSDAVSRGEWWRMFHDSTLNGLVKQALAGNQNLKVAAARIAGARAQDQVAASDFYPSVSFDPAATRERTTNTAPLQRGEFQGQLPGGGGGGGGGGSSVVTTQPRTTTFNLFRAPLDLSWEVDLFGRVRRSYEATRAQGESIDADFHNVALSVAANVAVNYLALRSLDAEAAILERTIEARRESARISQERLEAGLTSELDVTRARGELATNEAAVFSLARTRGQVENALATLLGQPASVLRVPRKPLPHDATPPQVPAGLPAKLLERRPDIASAERQLAAANARVGVAEAAFFPDVRLTGAGGFESAEIGRLFDWESRVWEIGPSLSLPVFDGGKNVANLGVARARYDQAVATYRGLVLTGFQEVEDALNDLRQLAGQAEAEGRALDASRRALVLAREQYDKGAVTFLEVLDAERQALAGERLVSQLAGQRLQATVQLVKALGGGWN